jgi:hypothetical protein
MRRQDPVAPIAPSATEPMIPSASTPDGNLSAMRALASAAHIDGSRVVSGSWRAPAAGSAAAARGDRSAATAGSPLDRPTVTGAGAGSAGDGGDHVGGGMLPPPRSSVALSDGTRISFRAVAEVAEFEDA